MSRKPAFFGDKKPVLNNLSPFAANYFLFPYKYCLKCWIYPKCCRIARAICHGAPAARRGDAAMHSIAFCVRILARYSAIQPARIAVAFLRWYRGKLGSGSGVIEELRVRS